MYMYNVKSALGLKWQLASNKPRHSADKEHNMCTCAHLLPAGSEHVHCNVDEVLVVHRGAVAKELVYWILIFEQKESIACDKGNIKWLSQIKWPNTGVGQKFQVMAF